MDCIILPGHGVSVEGIRSLVAQGSPFFDVYHIIKGELKTAQVLKAIRGFRKRSFNIYSGGDSWLEGILEEMEEDREVFIWGTDLILDTSCIKDTFVKALEISSDGGTAAITAGNTEGFMGRAGVLKNRVIDILDGSLKDDPSVFVISSFIRKEEEVSDDMPDMIKLKPAFKDYLWGGTKLKELYNKKTDMEPLAESWELSSHKDGESIIAEGPLKDMGFQAFLERYGSKAVGYKAAGLDRFPILIKFIDAKDLLSVQVHPDNFYGLKHENEFGKNEMWHILSCEEGSYIYYGVKRDISPEEFREKIADNTVTDVLNRVYVKPGDTFFVKAGTIHAIGKGIVILEIQQNSNCTYRIYDYDRRDKNGATRPLHVDKACDVCSLESIPAEGMRTVTIHRKGYEKTVLSDSAYFETVKYHIDEKMDIPMDDSSFMSVIFTEGKGTIETDGQKLEFSPGDSFYVTPGKKTVTIKGEAAFITTKV